MRFNGAIVLFAVIVSLSSRVYARNEPTVQQYREVFDHPANIATFGDVLDSSLCQALDCSAVDNLYDALYAIGERDHLNSMARFGRNPSFSQMERVAEFKIQKAIFSYPKRLPLYCAMMTSMARNYDDYSFAFDVLELALRVTRPSLDCIGPVVAALPQNDDTDCLLHQSRLSTCDLKL